jgi:hypothetical protein
VNLVGREQKKKRLRCGRRLYINREKNQCSSSFSSKIRFGRICSKTPSVIQYGKIKPIKKTSIQNAIPPIKRNKTIPKMLIFYYLKSDYDPKNTQIILLATIIVLQISKKSPIFQKIFVRRLVVKNTWCQTLIRV